jgi:hypothetical protein
MIYKRFLHQLSKQGGAGTCRFCRLEVRFHLKGGFLEIVRTYRDYIPFHRTLRHLSCNLKDLKLLVIQDSELKFREKEVEKMNDILGLKSSLKNNYL